jgi:protein ImuB
MLWLCLYFPQCDAQALKQVSVWAGQFTSRVSPSPPNAVLMEIGASLAYFGGLEALRSRINTGLERLAIVAASGIAPTPTAAWMLARSGDDTPITTRNDLRERLALLPITSADPKHKTMAALQGLGCQSIGEVRALPLAGLTRRLGREFIHQLQRAYGERPDPRDAWHPPHKHQSDCELAAETTHTDQLKPYMHSLIEALCGHLRSLNSGVMRLEFSLLHRHQAITPLTIGMLRPSHDPIRIKTLLDHRLERLSSPAGVIGLRLEAGNFQTMTPQRGDLLDGDKDAPDNDAWQGLVENLNQRLGKQRVRGLRLQAEHRPERAWCYQRPGELRDTKQSQASVPLRPFWLLPHPAPLESVAGRPNYHGPLILEDGPERIESGWWDGADISRDYYRARSPEGEKLWVFRDRRGTRDWFLHGIFA